MRDALLQAAVDVAKSGRILEARGELEYSATECLLPGSAVAFDDGVIDEHETAVSIENRATLDQVIQCFKLSEFELHGRITAL